MKNIYRLSEEDRARHTAGHIVMTGRQPHLYQKHFRQNETVITDSKTPK